MKKNIIIIILFILVLGLSGYLVFDKVLINNENEFKEEQDNSSNNDIIEKKDAAYFNEYLKPFFNCEGSTISKNTENFSNLDISKFVSRYYNLLSGGNSYYEVSVSDVDSLIYKYFNKNNIILETSIEHIATITKQEDKYIFSWVALGCGPELYKDPVVVYDGENVTVKYAEYAIFADEYTGRYRTYHLKYNNGNYNVIKIEE